MLKYKLLSVLVILVCIIISVGIIMVGYEKIQALDASKASLKSYEAKNGAPVNVLDPTSTSAGSSGVYSAELIIPKLGINCQIRSDTVNAYNAVYHYPESVDPGQNGECGLLGHRTTYSALFKNISSLKVGDEIIIKDYSNSKKYIYKVTSNGDDIRWDYKENPVKFDQSGEPRLLIMTCYPPGRKQAAYILHAKLVSTTSLN